MSKPSEVITFKVDPETLKRMSGIENRSDFIRNAILAALDNSCPFCKGTGVLTAGTKQHWEDFSKDHRVEECGDCNELKIECCK